MYLYFTIGMPKLYKYLRTKKWCQKVYDVEKWDKKYAEMENKKHLIPSMMFLFFLLFVPMRTGLDLGLKHKYLNKDIIPDHTLVFKDNAQLDIKKVGQNSTYFFYFITGEKVIMAAPIADNLKQIKKIQKE